MNIERLGLEIFRIIIIIYINNQGSYRIGLARTRTSSRRMQVIRIRRIPGCGSDPM